MINIVPLLLGILMVAYSVVVYFKVSGLKIFEVPSRTGMFYVSTYKYAAVLGLIVCLIYAFVFMRKVRRREQE
jgi:hypothetical protein